MTYSHIKFFGLFLEISKQIFMKKEKKTNEKAFVNVGYCESNSEWLNRIMTELADESKNFVDLSVLCA